LSPGSQRVAVEREREFPAGEIAVGRAAPIAVCHIDSGDLWAGAEVNTTTLLQALTRLPDLRLSAILLNEGEMARRLRGCGIDVKVVPESERSFVGIFNEAARFLRPRQVRILHAHRYKENLLAALLARRCRIPFLVSTRHGAPEPFRGWRRIKRAAFGSIDQLLTRHFTDRVISVSDEMREGLLGSLPPQKIVTIRTGIDTGQVRSELTRAEAKRRLEISGQAKVVGYAGRLVPIKRLDIFLQAARQIADVESDVVFVIAGDGPEQARLEALTRELGLGDRVRFLGFRERIYDVMRAFDVFVLCSDHEGLPRVVLEALCLGVPVVARAVGGIPEVIRNGDTGILLDSAEPGVLAASCRDLLADEGRRRQMAAAGAAEVSRRYPSERCASETMELYRALSEGQ